MPHMIEIQSGNLLTIAGPARVSVYGAPTSAPTPIPTLTSLSPATAVSDSPDFTLSCIGTNLGPSTVICFGDQDEPTTLVDATTVTTIVKPSLFTPAVVPVCLRAGTYQTQPLDFTFTAVTQEHAQS